MKEWVVKYIDSETTSKWKQVPSTTQWQRHCDLNKLTSQEENDTQFIEIKRKVIHIGRNNVHTIYVMNDVQLPSAVKSGAEVSKDLKLCEH